MQRAVDAVDTESAELCALVRIGGREAFWLRLHHPKAWGRVYQEQKKKWPSFVKLMRKWLAKREG